MHNVYGATYYHMTFNIEESNIKLSNYLECDTLNVGYIFCYAKTQSFYAITQNWLKLMSNADGHHKFVFLKHLNFEYKNKGLNLNS